MSDHWRIQVRRECIGWSARSLRRFDDGGWWATSDWSVWRPTRLWAERSMHRWQERRDRRDDHVDAWEDA